MSSSSELQTTLATALQTRYSLPASATWISAFLANARQPLPPFAALTSTAHFRILASDLTASLSSSNRATLFPPNISDVATKERRLNNGGGGAVPVQVLDIQDVGSSKWSQAEAIERVERGEEVRGREVIRTVAALEESDDDGDAGNGNGNGAAARPGAAAAAAAARRGGNVQHQGASSTKRSQGPHKLVLQDAAGTNVVAFELESVPKLCIGDDGINIGCKMVLQPGTLVRRGVVMLTPGTVRVLGGKIEPWDKKWREDRKKRLIDEASGG